MKKMQFVLVVLALLAMLTSIAATPMAISLIQVRNDPGGSVTFVFRVDGQLSKSQLHGTVHVNGEDLNFPLNCVQKDDTTVQCTTSRNAGGKNVVVTFGGASFWTDVPETVAQYCYNVYEYFPAVSRSQWTLQAFTTHCQSTPANYFDRINLMSPNETHFMNYIFMNHCDTKTEDAYYLCAQ